VKTSQAIMDRSQARFDSGLVVESDLLTAKVRMAARQQELIRARNNLDLARAQLSAAMACQWTPCFSRLKPWRNTRFLSLFSRRSKSRHSRIDRT